MNAIILAGGKGTRMREISDTPKVLLPIKGKPILEHAISNLIDYGVKKVFICVGELPSEIDYWIDDNLDRYRLEKIKDLPKTSGNSFGVLQSMKDSNQITLLAYGDTIFNLPIEKMLSSHIQNQNDITVLVRETDHPIDSDLAWEEDGVKFSKYPHTFEYYHGKLGVSAFYILSPQAFDINLSEEFTEWFELIQYFNNSGIKKIGLFKLDEGFIKDLGTPERYINHIQNDNY
ncbi:NTP transferase domain-containing protein [Schleiferiaceae bacterium]|nr:NTP transferase domain-containing protein [Schleiferiaceae bacterium]MDA9279172.1 NTP transferase domain-containing protein [Schleiferiaceae bacterium]